MSNPTPFWPYVVFVVGGIVLFIGAIFFLVLTVRTSGFTQWYNAFNAVLLIITVAFLLTTLGSKHE